MTRTKFDLTPYASTTIGFDKMLSELTSNFSNSNTTYPPYNIVEITDNEWEIVLAVAGFDMENLEITQDKNVLIVEGKQSSEKDERKYLHKGIGTRAFIREFKLADYIEVKDANIDLGLLTIKLVKNIPEEMRPKKIKISSAN